MKLEKPKKSPSIKGLRSKADELWQRAGMKKWGDKCICGRSAYCCHHIYPKGQYGHLRYNLDNAMPICLADHSAIHTTHDISSIMKLRTQRGEEWHKTLYQEANKTPSSYKGVKWYKDTIERLQKYLEM